jgi:hypothetical protein
VIGHWNQIGEALAERSRQRLPRIKQLLS